MAKIYVRCYRCSKKLADLEIKRIGLRIGTDESTFALCGDCVKTLEDFIEGKDTEADKTVVPVPYLIKHRYDEDKVNEPEKVDDVKEPEIKEPEIDEKSDAIKKFEERQAKAVKMEELDQRKPIDPSKPTHSAIGMNPTHKGKEMWYEKDPNGLPPYSGKKAKIDFCDPVVYAKAQKILYANRIFFRSDSEVRFGLVLQIEDLPRYEALKADIWAGYVPASEMKPEKKETETKKPMFPAIHRDSIDGRKRRAMNKGGIRCWNLIYLIWSLNYSLEEISEAYGVGKRALNHMTIDLSIVEGRVNKFEDYRPGPETELALKKFASDNNVRYEDLVYVREIKGPFDELMFKPAPDRTELDRNPVSYS